MTSILIADSHNLCREALCDYIRHTDPGLTVKGFDDCRSLYSHAMSERPDLVLIDSDLPCWEEGDFGDLKVGIIVSATHENMLMDPSLHGVFPKTLSCKSFVGGIREILAGRTFFPSPEEEETSRYAPSFATRTPQDFSLTGREKEVLTYLVKGQSNKDIARALDLQVVTVKLHVRGICRKMKVSNRTQAALTAKENGWG